MDRKVSGRGVVFDQIGARLDRVDDDSVVAQFEFCDMGRARELARDVDVVRVIVNQAHTFANGGGFDNGPDFGGDDDIPF